MTTNLQFYGILFVGGRKNVCNYRNNSGKYSFNREINDLRINREKVLLPVDDEGQPDYAFMEKYIREREKQLIEQYIAHIGTVQIPGGGITPLHEKEWKEFYTL